MTSNRTIGSAARAVLSQGLLEILPLTHIRGRSLHDSFVVVDEAQSLERNVLLTVLSRVGSGSRVVLTHGENEPRQVLAQKIQQRFKLKSALPEMGDVIEL